MKDEKLIVVKDNRLNAMRATGMSLNERRLFSTYVSLLNPNDEEKRCEVRFLIKDYLRLLGEKDKLSYAEVKETARRLRMANVEIDFGNRQWTTINLFSSITIDDGSITLETGGKAIALLFGLKGNFTRYYLWNVLRLESNASFRIYELLKQYENIGSKTMSVSDLKEWIGINKESYAVGFSAFRTYVLVHAQKELSKKTDISFTFKEEKVGRKIDKIHFKITRNSNPVQVGFDEMILEEMKKELSEKEENTFEQSVRGFADIDVGALRKVMKHGEISEEGVLTIITGIEKQKNRVKDRIKLFWYCIHNGILSEQTIADIVANHQTKLPKRDNFEQREYDDSFFDKIANASLKK